MGKGVCTAGLLKKCVGFGGGGEVFLTVCATVVDTIVLAKFTDSARTRRRDITRTRISARTIRRRRALSSAQFTRNANAS